MVQISVSKTMPFKNRDFFQFVAKSFTMSKVTSCVSEDSLLGVDTSEILMTVSLGWLVQPCWNTFGLTTWASSLELAKCSLGLLITKSSDSLSFSSFSSFLSSLIGLAVDSSAPPVLNILLSYLKIFLLTVWQTFPSFRFWGSNSGSSIIQPKTSYLSF